MRASKMKIVIENVSRPYYVQRVRSLSEFCPAADRAAWIKDMRTALEKNGISWTMWDYAGGFGVVF